MRRAGSRRWPSGLAGAVCLAVGGASEMAEAEGDADRDVALVSVRAAGEGFELLRGGEPYFVRGVGGDRNLELLARIGGNSFRTWGAEQLDETRIGDDGVERPLLDHAHRLGLTVAAGFWMEHPRTGFDYTDQRAAEAQLRRLRAFVEKHKDHPAILVWGIGNEVEIGDADREVVFRALNDAARMVKTIDPRRPTMVVVAEIGAGADAKGPDLVRLCPDVDIIGVNSYGGLESLASRLRAQGVDKPILVTEYGPVGHWETPATSWGAEYEQSSTDKAQFMATNYRVAIAESPGCLGGYAFLWGHKQERTATWYGMFLDDGTPLQPVEALERLWGGTPKNRAPRIGGPIRADFDPDAIRAGQTARASIDARDPDGDPLRIEWVIRGESADRRMGGDREAAPPEFDGLVVEARDGAVTFRAPAQPGAYRLFAYVYDGNWAATANLPFRVTEEP